MICTLSYYYEDFGYIFVDDSDGDDDEDNGIREVFDSSISSLV